MRAGGPPGRRLWTALYGWALRRRAPELWVSHGGEAVALFARLLDDAWRGRGWRGVLGTVWGGVRGLYEGDPEETGVGGRMGQGIGGAATALRQGLRALRRRPGYVVAVGALLGVGIGAVTTLVSLVDGILLRPLPYPDAERLVAFSEGAHTLPDLEDWRTMGSSWDLVAGLYTEVQALGATEPVRVRMARVTEGFFEGLGVRTRLGRLPTEEELRTDAPVAVADAGFWARHWGGDPGVVGRTVVLDGEPVTVIGVLSEDFAHPEGLSGLRPELWRPVPRDPDFLDRHSRRLSVYGRLRPGVDLAAARTEMDGIERELARLYPEEHAADDGSPSRDFGPEPLAEATVADARRPLVVLLWATLALLAVACANAASLVLAHGTGRRSELAVRGALGAGRGQLFGQLLVESLVVASVGGLLGVVLAHLGVAWVRGADPDSLPLLARVGVDLRVLGAASVLALATGVAFGLVPALRESREASAASLRSASARGGGSAHRVQSGLIVAEVALSTVLLAGTGFLLRSFVDLTRLDPGFETEPVWTVPVYFPPRMDEAGRAAVVEAMEARLSAIPGVEAVGAGLNVPFDLTGSARCCWWGSLEVDGRSTDDLWVRPVTPGYFAALGVPVEGRAITRDDAGIVSGVVPAVLNRAAARAAFGDDPVVGRRARFAPEMDVQAVGVVENTRFWGFDGPIEPAIYVSWAALGAWAERIRFAVRVTPGAGPEVARALRPALLEVESSLVVDPPQRLEDRMRDSLATRAFFLQLAGAFAVTALLLAAAGLYGTLLHQVRQRRREMGIRLALGAGRGRVAALIFRRGIGAVVAGVALGALAAGPVHRALGALLTDTGAGAAPTVAGVAAVLLAVGGLATWLPARSAARGDPRHCLESE